MMKKCRFRRFYRFYSGNGYSNRRFFRRFSVDSWGAKNLRFLASPSKNLRPFGQIPSENLQNLQNLRYVQETSASPTLEVYRAVLVALDHLERKWS